MINKDNGKAPAREKKLEGRFKRNMADFTEVLCQGSESIFLKRPWSSAACPQVVKKARARVQTEPALEDLDKVFKKFSPSQFLKTLKPWEISLIAKKKIKWNQPPFERLMSSSSLEKRPHFSFVKIQGDITSWSHATQPFPCYSQLRGSLPLQMSLFHSQSCLTLFVCWIPSPSARRLWESGAEEAKGVHSWPGAPIYTACSKLCTPFSNPDGGLGDQIQPLCNAVSTEYWERLSQAGRGDYFFLSRMGLSLMAHIKARQCGLISCLPRHFKNGPINKAWL